MKKSLIAIVIAATSFAVHANPVAPKVLFQQGKTLHVGAIQNGKVVSKDVFDGVVIVRLSDGSCHIENHRYIPNPSNPLDGKVDVSKSTLGYGCILNVPPAAPMDAFK